MPVAGTGVTALQCTAGAARARAYCARSHCQCHWQRCSRQRQLAAAAGSALRLPSLPTSTLGATQGPRAVMHREQPGELAALKERLELAFVKITTGDCELDPDTVLEILALEEAIREFSHTGDSCSDGVVHDDDGEMFFGEAWAQPNAHKETTEQNVLDVAMATRPTRACDDMYTIEMLRLATTLACIVGAIVIALVSYCATRSYVGCCWQLSLFTRHYSFT